MHLQKKPFYRQQLGKKFTISNIPTQDPEKKMQFCEALRKAGIAFCDLPDLDLTDGLSQVAVRDRDLGRFQYVFEEFTAGQLSGGKRSLEELKGVTSNHYTIKKKMPTWNKDPGIIQNKVPVVLPAEFNYNIEKIPSGEQE